MALKQDSAKQGMYVILFLLNGVWGLNQKLPTYTQIPVEYTNHPRPPPPPPIPSAAD